MNIRALRRKYTAFQDRAAADEIFSLDGGEDSAHLWRARFQQETGDHLFADGLMPAV
jgi:hypothetical protein